MTAGGISAWTDGDGDGTATPTRNSSGGGGASISSATPLINGVAAAGSGTAASADDHVHPTDTTRAALASPTFTGTPAIPTGTTGVTQSAADSSTKIATTAFVTTADNLKANLAGPTFTGAPVLPTGTTGVTQTAGDNSTKLATTAYTDAKEHAFMLGKAGAIGATETNAADFPFIVPFGSTMKRMKVVLASSASGAMVVKLRKASAPGTAVPSYSDVTGFSVTFANGSQIATTTPGTAVAVVEGDLLNLSCTTGSGTNLTLQVVTVTP